MPERLVALLEAEATERRATRVATDSPGAGSGEAPAFTLAAIPARPYASPTRLLSAIDQQADHFGIDRAVMRKQLAKQGVTEEQVAKHGPRIDEGDDEVRASTGPARTVDEWLARPGVRRWMRLAGVSDERLQQLVSSGELERLLQYCGRLGGGR